jgi:hypothetical protein
MLLDSYLKKAEPLFTQYREAAVFKKFPFYLIFYLNSTLLCKE